jgi:hypothetical protein
MAKAADIIYHIKNLKNSGKSSDDSQISDAQWLFIINQYRSQLIKNNITKGYSVNQELLQELKPSKITLTKNPIDDCEYYTQDIPKFIESHKNNLAVFVGTEGGIPYQRTTTTKVVWDRISSKKSKRWYEVGTRIYVRNHNKTQKLKVLGLFENPQEVEVFNDTLDEMNPFNFEYPVSVTMLDTIYKMIIDSEIRLLLGIKQDNLNDGRDGQ